MFSSHSIRKGGAHKLALEHVPPEAIQFQGGWRSAVYLSYTKFTREDTANAIRGKF